MDEPLSRRDVLRIGGVATAATSAGCFLGNPDVRDGVLFVENRTNESQRLRLRVTERTGDDGDPTIEERYRIPAFYALEFGEVLDSGTTYRIRAIQPDVPPDERRQQVTVDTCDPGSPEDRMHVSVIVSEEGPGVVRWGCTESYTQRERLTYADAAEYALGATTTASS